MISLVMRLWGLVSGSKIIWKVISNWRVLADATSAIENVITKVVADGRHIPNSDESIILLQALSNVLKTGVIDIPNVDEYEIAIDLDHMSSNISLSIKDSKSGRYFALPVTHKTELAKEEVKQ